jgi:predicted phosphate transport protein (TIGR00153 family)
MAKKHSNEYFEGFVSGMESACKAAEYLEDLIEHYDPAKLDVQVEEIHRIEHEADLNKHTLMQKLAKEFITPIEREDIILLLQQIDNVTDFIEDVVRKMFMYNVHAVRFEAVEFASIIKQCCYESRDALKELPGFQRSNQRLMDAIVKVNEFEEAGDRLYCAAMRRLYCENADPLERITWTKTFDWMEACCDACEDVMESVEMVVMKNS